MTTTQNTITCVLILITCGLISYVTWRELVVSKEEHTLTQLAELYKVEYDVPENSLRGDLSSVSLVLTFCTEDATQVRVTGQQASRMFWEDHVRLYDKIFLTYTKRHFFNRYGEVVSMETKFIAPSQP